MKRKPSRGATVMEGLGRVLLPYKVTAGFLFGVLLGVGILFGDLGMHTASEDTLKFIQAPNTKYWFALAILSLGFCSAIFVSILEWIWSLRADIFNVSKRTFILMAVWLFAIGLLVRVTLSTFFSYSCNYSKYFPNSERKSLVLGLCLYITLALGGVGMLWLSHAGQRLLSSTKASDAIVRTYLRFKEGAARLLIFFVINIALYPLTIRFKILAIENSCAGASHLEMYVGNPTVYLAYGTFFSLLLLVAYVPPYISLHDVGKKLCDQLVPLPDVSNDDWDTVYEKRIKIESALGVNKTWLENLVTALTILVPFLAGLFTSKT